MVIGPRPEVSGAPHPAPDRGWRLASDPAGFSCALASGMTTRLATVRSPRRDRRTMVDGLLNIMILPARERLC